MKRISDNWTKPTISTFSGETSINNGDNLWFPILKYWQELNLTQILLSINGNKLKCCQYNKEVYCCYPIISKMSMQPIQSPFSPTKPHEYLNQHQVGTWTLKCTRWNRTTKKLISPSFDFLDSVQIYNLPNVCFILVVLINW